MFATTVQYPYRDKDGEFTVHATVYTNGRISLDRIENEYGDDADVSDWTSAEQSAMKGLARKAYSQLEDTEDADDEADIQDEESNWR